MRKYTITLNEEQMLLISRCIEDISRFLAGDTGLYHTIAALDNWRELAQKLRLMQTFVTPELDFRSNYGWNGMHCPNEHQRKLIAQTYYLYREMLHQYNLANDIHNVYSSSTLRCADSGEPITITWEDEE
ncbi:MAG TPA: hypothetical protein H9824_05660 [Candidatus Bacteroides pullicola]|uniref:Uncharacterized protein n=1 Tax=Candidatus Bacteroides pullicola TaxID=2838475 RepID=A0A9D1ZI41_9BACE|nr:hypothetical protein [Candidatus Bacteroides pullicola]